MPIKRLFPVIPDRVDSRDSMFAARFPVKKPSFLTKLVRAIVPEVYDYRPFQSPIKDQKDLGCCTGFTYSELVEFFLRYHFNDFPTKQVVKQDDILSPLYIYYREREEEGTIYEDAGAQMRTGAKVLCKWGACLESEDPYNPRFFSVAPDPSDDVNAKNYKFFAYHKLNGLYDYKACLKAGYCFALGMKVYESFYNVGSDGMMPMPRLSEEFLGGHAVLVVGFDDKKQCLIVRNSWGTGWGAEGYFYMPYSYIQQGYTFDAWMVVLDSERFV